MLTRKTPLKRTGFAKKTDYFGMSKSAFKKKARAMLADKDMIPHPTLPNTLTNRSGTIIETRSKKVAEFLSSGLVQKASSFTQGPRKKMARVGSSPLQKMDAKLTALFSRMIRLKAANYEGFVRCYICQRPVFWREAECMHFQGRANKATRFSESANKAGCHECNSKPLGDREKFAKQLDKEYGAGHAEMLTILSKQELKMDREAYRYAIEYCESEIKKAIE